MANLESLACSTPRRETRGRASSTRRSVIAILGGVLLAGGCADLSEGPDDPPVDAGVTDDGSADAAIPDSGPEPATPVYFLVAELPGEEDHYDSYVLPLTRPDHIEHARALILHGHEERTLRGEALAIGYVYLARPMLIGNAPRFVPGPEALDLGREYAEQEANALQPALDTFAETFLAGESVLPRSAVAILTEEVTAEENRRAA